MFRMVVIPGVLVAAVVVGCSASGQSDSPRDAGSTADSMVAPAPDVDWSVDWNAGVGGLYVADDCPVVDGRVALPEAPGIGFERKADLWAVMKEDWCGNPPVPVSHWIH